MNYLIRLAGTGLSFLFFGLGALLFALFMVLFRFTYPGRERRLRTNQRVLHLLLRLFCFSIQKFRLVDIRISGLERANPNTNYFILVNHPTLIDAPVLLSLFPEAVCVVKSELGLSWIYRTLCEELGYLILGDSHLVDSAVEALAKGRTLLLFPEGTRSFAHGLRPFERGAAAICLRAFFGKRPDLEILPVTIGCIPPTLARGQRWYQIPDRRIDFRVSITYPFSPVHVLRASPTTGRAVNVSSGNAEALPAYSGDEGMLRLDRERDGDIASVPCVRTLSLELTDFLERFFEEQLLDEQRSSEQRREQSEISVGERRTQLG